MPEGFDASGSLSEMPEENLDDSFSETSNDSLDSPDDSFNDTSSVTSSSSDASSIDPTLSFESEPQTLEELVEDAEENLADITNILDRLFANAEVALPQSEIDAFQSENPQIFEKLQNINKIKFEEYNSIKNDIQDLITNLQDSGTSPADTSRIEDEIYQKIGVLREKIEEWFPGEELANDEDNFGDLYNADMNFVVSNPALGEASTSSLQGTRGTKNPLDEGGQVETPAAKRPRSTYAQASPSAFSNPPENMNISPNTSPPPSPRKASGLKAPPKLTLPPGYTPPTVQKAEATPTTAPVQDNVIVRQRLQNDINKMLIEYSQVEFQNSGEGKEALSEFHQLTNDLEKIFSKLNNNEIDTAVAQTQYDGLRLTLVGKIRSWMQDELIE